MATLAAMVSEVEDIVQDSSVTDDASTKINDGLKAVAGRVLIPYLDTIAEVDTSDAGLNYVSLPTNFHRNLGRWAYNSDTNRQIIVYPSATQLFRTVSKIDLAGNVFGVARQGGNLVYQRIPGTAQTLKIQYFKLPTALSADGDTPDCLPDHLHNDLLVNYACWKCWEKIEDGIDGANPNSTRYKALYEEALANLQADVGWFSDNPVEPLDELCFDNIHV